MSSQTEAVISARRAQGSAALIGYLTAGYPDLATTVQAGKVLLDNGVDILEIGLPYSDPGMDGGVIQHAGTTSLLAGTRTPQVFQVVEQLAKTGAPILVMSYFNPIFCYGQHSFARDLAAAGGAGTITADIVPDEAGEWIEATREFDLDRVFLVAPSSTDTRLELTARACRGFVYAASTMGVTGQRGTVDTTAAQLVARTRAAGGDPVCVGLGISTASQAAEIAQYADGVIVGSALLHALDDGLAQLAQLAADLADGCRSKCPVN